MISIDKVEAFTLVVEALERNDSDTASKLMKIISESIRKEKQDNHFSFVINIDNKKDEKMIQRLISKKELRV